MQSISVFDPNQVGSKFRGLTARQWKYLRQYMDHLYLNFGPYCDTFAVCFWYAHANYCDAARIANQWPITIGNR